MAENNSPHPITSEEQGLGLKDLMGMFLPKWYWFLISVVIALIIATLYLLMTPNLYTRSASLLIKEDSKTSNSLMSDIQDFGFMRSNTKVKNELETIMSPSLMTEVVKRLRLNDVYSVRAGLRRKDLYNESPIMVLFKDEASLTDISFKVTFTDDKNYEIRDCRHLDDEYDKNIKGTVGKPAVTPVGTVTILKTENFDESYIGKTISYSKRDEFRTAMSYDKILNASLTDKDASIISMTIIDASPKKAEEILSTLIDVYNSTWVQDRNEVANATIHFINTRLDVIEEELGNVDNNISSFKSAHLLPDIMAAAQLSMTENAEYKKQSNEINSQLSIAKYLRSVLAQRDFTQPLPSSSGMLTDANLASQISDYNKVLLNRLRLINSSSDKNPLVEDMTLELNGLHAAIVKSMDNTISALTTQLKDVGKQERETVSRLSNNPEQAKHLLSIERQQKVKEQLYIYLLQRREENELSKAFTAYNTRVITPPNGPLKPTSPKKPMVMLIAFIIGLCLPGVIIYFYETLNTRVRGRKDIEGLTIPFVGEIPFYGKKKYRVYRPKSNRERKGEVHPLVVKERNRNMINEAFRVVRTNLEFMLGADKKNQVIMLSSMNPGSGKTFITMNLAMSLAIKGKRVICVDLDLRRASLSSYANKPSTGLSNYFGNQCDSWREILVKGLNHENLDLLPAGSIPPNPAELLFSDRFETMLAELRQEYDLVFADCPPVDIVADTSIIAKWGDLMLFVIRTELMEREMLPQVEALYTSKRFNNMALLLNGTTPMYGGRYGYHRYGYRYGYNYGYGNYGDYYSKEKK